MYWIDTLIQLHNHARKEGNGVDTLYTVTHLSIISASLLDLANDTTSCYFSALELQTYSLRAY